MLPDTEAGRSLIPLVKSFVAHHRGAEPGNLRPVFIVKQQICVCFFLSNALWHSTAPAGLGHTWMMPQSKWPRPWGRALGELLLGSWTSLGRGRGGRGGGEEKQQQLCCHQQAAPGFVHMNRRVPRGEEQAQGTALPARLRARPHTELVRGKPSTGSGSGCPVVTSSPGKVCFCFAAKARGVWLQVCTSPPPAGVYIALIRLHFCFLFSFFFPF